MGKKPITQRVNNKLLKNPWDKKEIKKEIRKYLKTKIQLSKIYESESVSRSVTSHSLQPHMDCSPPGSSVHTILQARILEWVTIHFWSALPNPGTEPRSLALQADSLPPESPEKPKIYGTQEKQVQKRSL